MISFYCASHYLLHMLSHWYLPQMSSYYASHPIAYLIPPAILLGISLLILPRYVCYPTWHLILLNISLHLTSHRTAYFITYLITYLAFYHIAGILELIKTVRCSSIFYWFELFRPIILMLSLIYLFCLRKFMFHGKSHLPFTYLSLSIPNLCHIDPN